MLIKKTFRRLLSSVNPINFLRRKRFKNAKFNTSAFSDDYDMELSNLERNFHVDLTFDELLNGLTLPTDVQQRRGTQTFFDVDGIVIARHSIYLHGDTVMLLFFDKSGKLHRDNAPAVIEWDFSGRWVRKEWVCHGNTHNLSAPALVTKYNDGTQACEWFIHNKEVPKSILNEYFKDSHNPTNEEIVIFKLLSGFY